MKNKKILLYAVTSDAGENTMVLATSLLNALDLWREENVRERGNVDDITWPVSIALIHEGTILGENN